MLRAARLARTGATPVGGAAPLPTLAHLRARKGAPCVGADCWVWCELKLSSDVRARGRPQRRRASARSRATMLFWGAT